MPHISLDEVISNGYRGWKCVLQESEGTTRATIQNVQKENLPQKQGLRIILEPGTLEVLKNDGTWGLAELPMVASYFANKCAFPAYANPQGELSFNVHQFFHFTFLPPS